MNFSQDTSQETTLIHSYTDSYLVINERKFDGHCLVHRDGLIELWNPADVQDLRLSDFETIINCKPDVILLGTGLRLNFPSNELRQHFLDHRIGLEVMDTGAACRTYNILLAEGRNVAAAILLNQGY
jgi:uncharacterized protein